jgi:eukaryotic-like serine/threonine-protein kinase
MQDRKPRHDPQDRGKNAPQGGVGVPTKGDSSSSNAPLDSDAPTIIDFSSNDLPKNFPKPGSDPDATYIDPDATYIDPKATNFDPDATMVEGMLPPLPPRPRGNSRISVPAPMLEPGDVLGGRYEIIQLLGEGGMGAVYKARDRELDRPVALKLIRPEMASNAGMLARFKQELLLSRQVTHKNVIRIFDLGDADGVKFITMEFVEGQDLRSLIQEKQKFSPPEAVEIMQQVCQALEAAHGVGVIHRDLKPQNIMRENTGRILVMDFGLARTMQGDGMTQVGALVGTMEYMSPEQALAKELDQRSDLFTAGLILYELLTGKMPFKAESALASLIKRTQERAVPVSDHDGTIPAPLSAIVSKCLETDSKLRYQSATEMLRDLDAWQGNQAAATLGFHANVKPWGQTIPWPLVAGVVTVLLLGTVGYIFRGPLFSSSKKSASAPALSLAIVPFRNASGDPAEDWLGPSIADMLSTDVGQSSRLHTVSQDQLHQVLSDLRVAPNATMEPTTLKRLAEFSSADTLVWGQYSKVGTQIRIDATVQDLKRDRSVPIKIDAVDEKDIPAAVDRLAASIRNNLSFSSDAIKELAASSFQPSSQSPAALRDFNQGMQQLRDGKNLDAVKALQTATEEDPNFALAYSRLAEADSALGFDTQAEEFSRKAVDLSQQLPAAEKYLIEANHAYIMKDDKKAIQAFETLAKTFIGNTDIEYTLGSLYSDNGQYDKASTQFAAILKANPKNIHALWQMGMLEYQQENYQAALEPLNQGLSLSVQTDNPEQRALILQALGICYRLMNKPDEAIKSIQDSMEIARKLGLKRLLAANLAELATNQTTLGKPDVALDNFNQSLQILRDNGMKRDLGVILINRGVLYQSRGDLDKALQDYKDSLQIARDTADIDLQALSLSNIGAIYSQKNDTDNALIYYQQSLQLREQVNEPVDMAETLSALGDVYSSMGDYDKALENLMKALDISRKANDTKGAAGESQSIGGVLMYQGRLGAAVSAMQDSLNGYRTSNNKSDELADSLNGLAESLALVGRGDESGKLLDEGINLASVLKNESIHSELLNTRGDVAFYHGDYASARTAYEQAVAAATKAKDLKKILIAKMNLARTSVAEGRPQAAIPELRAAIQEADTLRLKFYWLRGSVDLADAMIRSKDYAHARQQLDTALNTSEKLGTRLQTALIHFQLGHLLKQTDDAAGAAAQYHQAVAILDEIKKEQGAERVLDRADLKAIYKEATNSASAGN